MLSKLTRRLQGLYLSKYWEKYALRVGQSIEIPCPPLWFNDVTTITEDASLLASLQLMKFTTWSQPLSLTTLSDTITRQHVPPFISLSRSPQFIGVYFGISPCWNDVVLVYVPEAGGEISVLNSIFLSPNKRFWLSGPPGLVYLVARGSVTPSFVTETQPGNVIPLIIE
ncbi:MAG: hypothetical protein WCK11_05810 [Candidatus Falkowbacteria bacterium]